MRLPEQTKEENTEEESPQSHQDRSGKHEMPRDKMNLMKLSYKDFKISILDAQRTNKICGESKKINENTISRKTENLKRNKQKKSGAEKHHY